MLKTLSVVVALGGLAATLSAQTYPDTFKVTYYSNANANGGGCSNPLAEHDGQPHNMVTCSAQPIAEPDATVRLTNVGTQIGSASSPSGNLCAMVYVLTPDQQLAECCGCALSPDALVEFSVNNDLTSNPLTAVTPTTGDIKIISSSGAPSCNPSKPVPVPGIRAWATHIQVAPGNSSFVDVLTSYQTETAFTDSTLSSGELKSLESKCKAIQTNGSGFGLCSCGNSAPL